MDQRKMFGLVLCAAAVYVAGGDAACSTHYVSPEGGNVPPYTTPETAARGISDAVQAAEWGATILVAPGAYLHEDVQMKPAQSLEGSPHGAAISHLGSLRTAEWCEVRNLTFDPAGVIAFRDPSVSVTACEFRNVTSLWVTELVTVADCSFCDVGFNTISGRPFFSRCVFIRSGFHADSGIFDRCSLIDQGLGCVEPGPFFAGCTFDRSRVSAGYGAFLQCSFTDTHGSAENGLFIQCVAGRESGFTGGSREDYAVFKHCTLGYLCFEGFLLVEDCIIGRIWDGFPPQALHTCIVGTGEFSEEDLATTNSRYDTPVFVGWVAYEDTGVYVAPGGEPEGDGTEGGPLPLVSSGLYQTYDYHLVAGSPGVGEATDGGNIGAYPHAEPLPRGTDKVVVNIAPGRYVEYLEDFYGRGSIHLRKHGEGEVRIELPPQRSLFTDETDVLEGITFAGGRVGGRARILDCVFHGSPDYGLACGGPQEAPSSISRCRFESNGQAGALVWRDHVAMFDNCVFTGNGTGLDGYGLAIATNCAISGNESAISGNVDMTNSIVWGNHLLCDATPSSLVATYSLIQGGYSGEGNIQSDPLFIDVQGGDFRLRPDSPCIDAGFNYPDLPETDIVGMHRIMFGGKSLSVDMGAYEYYINDLNPGAGADEATLTWSSWHRRTYSILYSDDLITWYLADDAVASAGYETTSWIDDGSKTGLPPTLAPRRFYRVLENR